MSNQQYVECDWCKNWVQDEKTKRLCGRCQNTRLVQNPRDILCNMCGECMCPLGTMNEQSPNGLHNAIVVGGYDSYHLLDCHSYKFSLCEKCLRDMFSKAKIKPSISEVWLSPVETERKVKWEDDQNWYEYKVWRDGGGHHQNYLDQKCNCIQNCPNKAEYTVWYSDEFSEDCVCEEHKDYHHLVVNATLTKFVKNHLKPFL